MNRSRAMSRRSSASVFGGSGVPSGVRSCSSRAGALQQGRFETADAEAGERALHPVPDAGALADDPFALAARPLGILYFDRRDRGHAAVVPFATQPAEKGALQKRGIGPVGLRPAVLARHGNAGRMHNMGFDAARSQPAGHQKPSRPASKATAMRVIVRPAFVASSRQRCSSRSSADSSASSFFAGWRSIPGTTPATSQLDWLISMTAISVLS
jgi:hypothetical protein